MKSFYFRQVRQRAFAIVPMQCKRVKRNILVLTACFVWGCLSIAPTVVAQTTWIGGSGNNWFTNGNWNTNLAPNGATIDVIIGSPAPVVLNGNAVLNSLSIDGNGVLQTNQGTSLSFGGTSTSPLTNLGSISLATSSHIRFFGNVHNGGSLTATHAVNTGNSDLRIMSAGATFSGGGTITLAGAGGARITAGDGSGMVTIQDQTIQGRGQIGTNNLQFRVESEGVIDGNSTIGHLILDTSAGGMVNLGVLRASSGGILRITDSNIDNTSGLIEALAGSTVNLRGNSSITAGTLTGPGTILIESGESASLINLTNSGTLSLQTSATVNIGATINNTGNINLNHAVNTGATNLSVMAGGASLDGGGTVTMGGTGSLGRVTGVAGELLTIRDQTIQGRGQIGFNAIGLALENGALIDANSTAGALVVNSGTPGVTNQSIMRASNGGNLFIDNSTINNSGGLIEAQAGSTVSLGGDSSISGGTLSGDGSFAVLENHSVSLTNLSHTSTMTMVRGSEARLSGLIDNSGTITMNHPINTGAPNLVIEASGVTLDGGGTIQMFGSGNTARITGGLGGTLLIANQTIEGGGNVGFDNLSFVNSPSGTIHANLFEKSLRVDPVGTSFWANDGTLRASNGGTLELMNATQNNGLIDVKSAGRVEGSLLINEGTVALEANSVLQAVSMINNGFLTGSGLVGMSSELQNNGLIAPGVSAGTLTLNVGLANATFGATSELLIEIAGEGGGQFDLLDVNFTNSTGKLFLGGDLIIDLDGYLPTFSDQFVVLTADNLSLLDGPDLLGSFANVANGGFLTTLGGEGYFTVSYGGPQNGNRVLLSNFVSVPEPTAGVLLWGAIAVVGMGRRRKA